MRKFSIYIIFAASFIILFVLPDRTVVFAQMVGKVAVVGSGITDADQIIEFGLIRPQTPFNEKAIHQTNEQIVLELQNEGYLYARVDSVAMDLPDSSLVNLTWYVNAGPLVRLGIVNIPEDTPDYNLLMTQLDLKEGQIYSQALIESEIQRLNQFYALRGHPFARIQIAELRLEPVNDEFLVHVTLTPQPGDTVKIEQIQINGNNVTQESVILRELDVGLGDIYNQDKIDQIPQNLNKLGFFKAVEQPRLTINSKGKNTLLLQVEEGNTTTFDGVVGYIPPSQVAGGEDGYFTGLIDLSFRNLFGTGRKFTVHWRKQDRFSDEFRLYYQEPWIFGLPINVGAGLHRLVRDTTYIERSYTLDGVLRFSGTFSTTFSVLQQSYTPDSLASRVQRLAQNDMLSGEVGIIYDTRDLPVNPRKGLYYDTYYSFGFKENTGPEYLFSEDGLARREEIQRIRINLAYFQRLWQNQVLALNIFGGRVEGSENQLQLTDHFWFGGARTVRGYREDQFHGTTVSYVNLEYRFLTGRESRIYLFNDWGFYQYKTDTTTEQDILPGYGVGIRFSTPLGIMSVDYGLGRKDTFSTGKIHIGIVNVF